MSYGNKLISQIASNTGLPEEMMVAELGRLIGSAGLDKDVVSLDDLRRVLAEYAQEILLSAKEALENQQLRQASGD